VPKQPLKFFLIQDERLVLANATEEAALKHAKEAAEQSQHKAETLPKFKLVVGRELPMEIDTGVRVKVTKRSHKKTEGNGNGRKKKAAKDQSTLPIGGDAGPSA
jgi:hypothetical protein